MRKQHLFGMFLCCVGLGLWLAERATDWLDSLAWPEAEARP